MKIIFEKIIYSFIILFCLYKLFEKKIILDEKIIHPASFY